MATNETVDLPIIEHDVAEHLDTFIVPWIKATRVTNGALSTGHPDAIEDAVRAERAAACVVVDELQRLIPRGVPLKLYPSVAETGDESA